jgi:hypothetical protein
MSVRLIDVLGLLAGAVAHPGNNDNETYLAEERLHFAAQQIHERIGRSIKAIKDDARRLWAGRSLDAELYRVYGDLDESSFKATLLKDLERLGFKPRDFNDASTALPPTSGPSNASDLTQILDAARRQVAATNQPQDMRFYLSDVSNFSARAGKVTPDQLPEIMVEVEAWQRALLSSDRNEEGRHKETFRALTWCLEKGRTCGDPPMSSLPLGNPQLEDALWHLYQIACRPYPTDRERMEALKDVLEPAGVAPTLPTIWFHAERQYSIDRVTLLKVSEEFDYILQAFLESQAAMETSDIERKAGVTNASRAIKSLAEWNEGVFNSAIRIPRGKAKGGYFIRVKSL